MGTISTFTFISVDGFFAGPNGEIDWFKDIPKDKEFDALSGKGSQSGGALIFGHTTYEMMKSYWPGEDAIKSDPDMAKVMNNSKKIVFSKTLKSVEESANWKNVELFHGIDKEKITKLKEQEENGLTILGSGTIVQQFSNLGLIDVYQLVIVPIILGEGKYLFKDVKQKELKLIEGKTFKNGLTWLNYTP